MTVHIRQLSAGLPPEDAATAEAALVQCQALNLAQHWLPTPQSGFQPGYVRLGWQPSGLTVFAELHGDDFFNTATTHNTPTHETGDVFELFFDTGAHTQDGSYAEFHITPDNVRLQLLWPGVDSVNAVRAGDGALADYCSDETLFHSSVQSTGSQWLVLATIPARSITGDEALHAGQTLRASFCRYDAFRDGREPVISSVSRHPVADFHRPQEWPEFVLI